MIGPKRDIPEFYDLRVAETILSGYFGSRLNLIVREKLNLTYGISAAFLGHVIVPIVGNIAENIVAIKLAYQDRMDFSMLVSLGSSLQVALGVAPILVFASLFTAHEFDLVFPTIQVIALAAAVTITALIAADGESNWLEGAQLMAVYVILGLAFYFVP